jgi:uncharacterized membrane protein/mono/diheme cytochrome c family protein
MPFDGLSPLTDLLANASVATSAAAAAPEFTPTRFLGRSHPILVHFPIALLVAAAANELQRWIRRIPGASPATFPLVAAAALTAVAATVSGWMNAAWEHDGSTSETLLRHRWLGTIVTGAMVMVAILAERASRSPHAIGSAFRSAVHAQRLGAIACALLVGLVGHLGGALVHGEGYLMKGLFTRPTTAAAAPRATADDAMVGVESGDFYRVKVEPILVTHCVECHGPDKQKGGLQLEPIAAAFDVPPDRWTIIPGKPDESYLLERILLPRDDVDAMPPEDKGPGLTDAEIKILREWIENGARFDTAAESSAATEPSSSASNVRIRSSPEAIGRMVADCLACGAIAQPRSLDEPYIEINAARATPAWTDEQLRTLLTACDAIVSLNLAGSKVTDAGVGSLPPLVSLERLRLDRTAVGDAALRPFLTSERLTTVNLVGTFVGDEGLLALLGVPSLREVHVWESKVTESGIAAARERRPDVRVIGAEAPPRPAAP